LGGKRLKRLLRIKVGNLAVDKCEPGIKKHPYPLLFIHGAGGTSRYLENYLLFFARTGWTSYAVNLRGHFPSEREAALAQVTIEDYIADVERVMRVLGIKKCALIGHSMGGLIAQKAAMYFKSVKALVTICSAPPSGVTLEMKNDLPYPEAIMHSMWGLMNLKPVKLPYFMAEKTVLNNIEESERKNIFPMFVAESLMVGYQVAQGVYVDPQKISCPKLVIGCLLDTMAPESMERKLAEFLQADYISYTQFAHLPMLEKGWEQSATDISKWLIRNVPE
jgi:pimeloyl-ACP methyl ester carboxylesterase